MYLKNTHKKKPQTEQQKTPSNFMAMNNDIGKWYLKSSLKESAKEFRHLVYRRGHFFHTKFPIHQMAHIYLYIKEASAHALPSSEY